MLSHGDIPGGVAGLQLQEARDVPEAGEEDHGHDVDGAGVAAHPVAGGSGVECPNFDKKNTKCGNNTSTTKFLLTFNENS